MSDPTYRIDVAHHPYEAWPWKAHVHRLSDESLIGVKVGNDPGEVTSAAQSLVHELTHSQLPGFSVLVDEDGEPVEGHSVRA